MQTHMIRPFAAAGWRTHCYSLAALALLACKDNGPCVALPCPISEAVRLVVTTPGSTARPAGLAVAVGDGPLQAGLCDMQDAVCHVSGGPGDYRLAIAATGFATQQVRVTVTGEEAGCGTCGRVDRQDIAVVLQPVAP